MIIDIDDWRASMIIQTPKTQRVHLVPVSFFEDVAEGKRKITDLDDWESITEIIITEWLRARKENAP